MPNPAKSEGGTVRKFRLTDTQGQVRFAFSLNIGFSFPYRPYKLAKGLGLGHPERTLIDIQVEESNACERTSSVNEEMQISNTKRIKKKCFASDELRPPEPRKEAMERRLHAANDLEEVENVFTTSGREMNAFTGLRPKCKCKT